MSINITVHGSPSKRYSKTKILLDPEGNKKQLLEERRKLRLGQVRQKSKELASQIRKKVDNEQQKQLKIVEKTKKEELKNWKLKMKHDLNKAMPEIGAAHRAAEKESDSIFYKTKRKESLDLIPAVLNKNTKLKRDKKISNLENKENKNINDQENGGIRHEHSDKILLQEKNVISDLGENKLRSMDNSRSLKRSDIHSNKASAKRFQEPNFNSYASFKESKANIDSKKLKKTPSLIMSVGSSDTSLNSTTSSLEIEDMHNETNQHFRRIYSKEKLKTYSPRYKKHMLSEFSGESDSVNPGSNSTQKALRTRYTKISDFLNKNRNSVSDENKKVKEYELIDQVLQPNDNKIFNAKESGKIIYESTSNSKNFNTESSNQINNEKNNNLKTIIEQQETISKTKFNKQENPSNITRNSQKSIRTFNAQSKGSSKTFQQQQKRNSNKLELNEIISSYDYKNRFQKNIDRSKYSNVICEKNDDENNATQNAMIERQLQYSREKELDELRKKSEERGQQALEREKVRRDYEMLEAKLETLTKTKQSTGLLSNIGDKISEVRLKQMENERINKINANIENIIKRPVVITLPENTNNDYMSSKFYLQQDDPLMDVNLGNLAEDSGTINSSDSCCSILLNYVDDQAKQINKDIKNSDNIQKSKKLKELLSKLEILKLNLLKELEKSEKTNTENKNIQTMFDSITDLRKQRENIMLLNTEKKDLEKREKQLKQREEILEKKLREFYEMKRSPKENIKQFDVQSEKSSVSDPKQNKNNIPSDQYRSSEKNSEYSRKSDETQDESSECIAKEVISVNKPIEIVIKVKDSMQKTPFKSKKRASLIQKDKQYHKIYTSQKVSTPLRSTDDSESTGSTLYKSPPDTMRNNLGDLINKDAILKKDNLAKSIDDKNKKPQDVILNDSKPNNEDFKLHKNNNLIKRTPAKINKKKIQKKTNTKKLISKEHKQTDESHNNIKMLPSGIQFDPQLANYIQRVLGMSRNSIRMLDVSSSEVETPNSSVINVPSNIPLKNQNDQEERIRRIESFINDNYSFVNEIEESIRKEEKSTNSSEESVRLIEEIWKETLKKKKKIINGKEQLPKPILKKNINIKKQQTQVEKIKTSEKIEKKLEESKTEEKVIEKYTELTDNCNQRIAELNQMIDRVRKEKQKILEITLSSNGGGNSETEYLDFVTTKSKPEKINKVATKKEISKEVTENRKIIENMPPINTVPDISVREQIDSIERVQLEKNKLTGVSRDSGISLSRPITAQDNRDSPSFNEKIEEKNFEPFLKDIPKPNTIINMNKPTVVNMSSISITKQISINPDSLDQQTMQKKNKPPPSITRYSPQLVEDMPHELSTILEIETPATSRLNTTLKDNNQISSYQNKMEEEKEKQENQKQEQEQEQEQEQKHFGNKSSSNDTQEFNINFRKYPTFEEYAIANNLNIENFDPEKSAYIRKLYEELCEQTQNIEINYRKFPSINSFNNEEKLTTSNKTDDDSLINLSKKLNLKKFLTPTEYFKKIGANDLLDSKSLIEKSTTKSSTLKENDQDISSDEEFSKEWCLRKFPELKEFLKNAGISDDKEISCNSNQSKDEKFNSKIKNITTENSDSESLPDVNAELKRRNILKHSFKNQIFSESDSSAQPKKSVNNSTSTDTVTVSSSSKENKNPDFFLKTKSLNDISGIEHILKSQTISEIGKEFEEMGLKWASSMLKKQEERRALGSSTSSSFSFQNNEKKSSTPKTIKKTMLDSETQHDTKREVKAEQSDSTDTTNDEKFGKPLNLREFLKQQLKKHTFSSTDSTSLTDDSLASLFLRSLLNSSTPTPKVNNENGAAISSDRQQKTSTPVLLEGFSSSRKSSSVDSNGVKLFSGESRISSVHFNNESCSSSSNAEINKNLKRKKQEKRDKLSKNESK